MSKFLLLLSLLLGSMFFCQHALQAQNSSDILLLKTDGKVVIGDPNEITTPDGYNLYVQNGILTERVKVAIKSSSDWMDNAFSRTPTLEAMENSILNDKHLYSMPSGDELVKTGYEVQKMDAKLLEQIEWLWQYTIALDKENKALKAEIEALKSKQ